jgi:ABC-2 type transport system ATP-binding protein
LNLTIKPGELFAFLGPNGAGKTTAMKLLTGLMKPDSGRVKLCGHDVQLESMQAKSLLGYVPDVAVFYEKLTPTEFMEFIAELFEMYQPHAEAQTDVLFTKFALHEYSRQRIENLSHGTRQRLAIASALLHDPKVFVIDEPMVGLDPIHARTLNIAEELADRIGIIHHGKLIALGTLEELRRDHEKRGRRLEDIFLSMVE